MTDELPCDGPESRWRCPECGNEIEVNLVTFPPSRPQCSDNGRHDWTTMVPTEGGRRMSDEKPLHVQVAEALGCKVQRVDGCPGWTGEHYHCVCYNGPHVGRNGCAFALAEFDTDWSAIGSLIERYRITLGFEGASLSGAWIATDQPLGEMTDGEIDHNYFAARMHSNPLIAVCHLLLALKEAGKLTPRI